MSPDADGGAVLPPAATPTPTADPPSAADPPPVTDPPPAADPPATADRPGWGGRLSSGSVRAAPASRPPDPSDAAPGWRPKLVALDIDGTIVGFDGWLPDDVKAVLSRVTAAGVPIVLATGRAWLSAKLVLDELALPWSYCVCNNGATVCTYPPLAVVQTATFDARPIVAALRHHPTAVLAVEEFGVGYRATGPFPVGELHGEFRIVGWDELAPGPVSRIIVRDPAATSAEFLDFCRRLDLRELSYFIGWTNWLDVASADVDKAAGLEVAADRLGVSRADVLALGDGLNDIELLAWAGRGVAMGQAPDALKQVADAVTGAFADGGAVAELSRWF
ncbi:MAG: Cof-type HAD-IIB family hydrolase [Propionibacteriaceae bacterium]|jgi:hydroxymethylpyrimidine pyrophosphatase-like HAD family hydrolase|nr:Cof-type HAD-IIB family hydrolase [Propionibacteriaceae bacterium]